MEIEVLTGVYDSNTFIISSGSGVLIVDSGASTADIVKSVGSRPVFGVLITHEHFDHLTNCADYAARFNTKIYCSRETLDNLKYYKPVITFEGTEFPIATLNDASQVVVIKDEQDFTIGGFTVKPYFAPGHSAGSIVYRICCVETAPDGEGAGLFTGDVLFARGVGRTDFMTDGKKYMRETLDRLKDIKFETACHGHGEASSYKSQQRNIEVFAKWLKR
jgi:glyoxylase-like metal-dependent hydrolase (beta-lactamase superfamily II)